MKARRDSTFNLFGERFKRDAHVIACNVEQQEQWSVAGGQWSVKTSHERR
jgi:hypothetical protein